MRSTVTSQAICLVFICTIIPLICSAPAEDSAVSRSNRHERSTNGRYVKHLMKRQAADDSADASQSEEEDGGYTREAAIVSPIRRRRSSSEEDISEMISSMLNNTDDGNDTESESDENVTSKKLKRQEDQTTTVPKLVPMILVAPSDLPVKEIPKAVTKDLTTIKQKIDKFEEKVAVGQTTMATVGVVAGENTPKDTDTVIHTISSSQYIVH